MKNEWATKWSGIGSNTFAERIVALVTTECLFFCGIDTALSFLKKTRPHQWIDA